MKHLFFAVVAFAVYTANAPSVNAQANINVEKFAAKSKSATSLKFIDNIEINPVSVSAGMAIAEAAPAKMNVAAKSIKDNTAFTIEQCTPLHFKYAQLMDVEVEQVSNTTLYNFIDSWWGTRYRYGGKDRNGIDCSAFCSKLLNDVYGLNTDRMAKDQFKQCEKISSNDLKEGDLVFFNTRGGVSHVGTYLGNNFFVHSSVHSGVTISSLTDAYYTKTFIGGGRIKQ